MRGIWFSQRKKERKKEKKRKKERKKEKKERKKEQILPRTIQFSGKDF